MISHKHLRELIIRPSLDQLRLYSLAAEELLIITVAQETHGGQWLMQNGRYSNGWPTGPALGIYQVEPASYRDLFDNWIKYHVVMWERLVGPTLYVPDEERMVYDLRYATGVARLYYYRIRERLPAGEDIEGLVRYYKKYWNTELGKATLEETKRNYERYIGS